MSSFFSNNVFSNCNADELKELHNESKLYKSFIDIPETSILNKYKEKFLKISKYKTYTIFHFQLIRACINKHAL